MVEFGIIRWLFFAHFANPWRPLRLRALELLTAKVAKNSRKEREAGMLNCTASNVF
jgi:hypothetical protein